MNTYRVVLGRFANTPFDVKIVRAKNCSEAEKKAIKAMGEGNPDDLHVIEIKQLDGEFVE